MKKNRIFKIIMLIFLLCGCKRNLSINDVLNMPHFEGKVLEVYSDYVLIGTNDISMGNLVSVSLDPIIKDSYTNLSVGDIVVVYYDIEDLDNDSTAIDKVYFISLQGKVDLCNEIDMVSSTDEELEICGIERIYEELSENKRHDATYLLTNLDHDHIIDVTNQLSDVIWSWYLDKAAADEWKNDYVNKEIKLVYLNDDLVFSAVIYNTGRLYKYFLFSVKNNGNYSYTMKKVHEYNENTVKENLKALLSSGSDTISINRDFPNYFMNSNGIYVPYVDSYDNYRLAGESKEKMLNIAYSYIVNVELDTEFSVMGYFEVNPYYYYQDDILTDIYVDVSDGYTMNKVYHFDVSSENEGYYLAVYDEVIPNDGDSIVKDYFDYQLTITRYSNVLKATIR